MKRNPPQLMPGTKRVRIITYKIVKRSVMQVERPYVLFREAVRNARHELGWNQQELAGKLGYSRGSIANIEVGRQRILLTDLFTFAKILKLNPKALFAAVPK